MSSAMPASESVEPHANVAPAETTKPTAEVTQPLSDSKEQTASDFDRTFANTQADLEAETSRAAQLTDELEVAQMKLVQYETEVQRKEKGFLNDTQEMATELDTLRTQLEILKQEDERQRVEKEELRTAMAATIEELQAEIGQFKSDKDRDDTENTIIMKLLHTELDKYKTQAANLQAEFEQKERDDVKNTIMLGLLNSQLDAAKDESKRSNDVIYDYKKKVELLDTKLEESIERVLTLEDEQDRLTKESTIERDKLLREIDLHKAKVEQLEALTARIQGELDTTKAQYLQLQTDSEAREREAFESNVVLKTENHHYKTLAATYTADMEKSQREWHEKSTYQTSTINALKAKLSQLQETHESAEKAAFETITSTRAELESVRIKYEDLQKSAKHAEQEYVDKCADLSTQIAAEKQRHAQSQAIADKKEAEFFKQITRLTTEVDSLEQQLHQSQALHEKKDKGYTEKTIVLNSENEGSKNKLILLQQEFDEHKKVEEKREIERMTEINLLKQRIEELTSDYEAKQQQNEEVRVRLEDTLKGAHAEIDQVKSEASKTVVESAEEKNALVSKVDTLQDEIKTHLETIQRLEDSIAKNFDYKALAEQNDILKTDVEGFKNQIKNLNNTVSTMKIESDILDNYKTKVLTEQNDQQLLRIQDLERERKQIAPLMSELISTLQKHGLHTTLKGDIETYKSTFLQGRGPAAADTKLSNGRSSPAAMGRHKLDPLPSPSMYAAAP